jgi:hypothetical protein
VAHAAQGAHVAAQQASDLRGGEELGLAAQDILDILARSVSALVRFDDHVDMCALIREASKAILVDRGELSELLGEKVVEGRDSCEGGAGIRGIRLRPGPSDACARASCSILAGRRLTA